MSDEKNDAAAAPVAAAQNTRFSAIWLIPIVALVVAAFLGWQAISNRGPLITIEFNDAEGLTAGQTQVKHKNVALGTVESVRLSDDMKVVLVHVRMTREANKILTEHTRFWVVRPRLSGASISGLETLVSGAYIAIDPGGGGGPRTTFFKGLEGPPGVRSDEPGRTYTLMTNSVISIGEGSPVIYRGVNVGEVLGYTMPPTGRGPIPIQIFVHDPYDHYIRTDTRFWNASGVAVNLSGGSVHVQVESLQAALSGAVGFGLPSSRHGDVHPEAPGEAVFKLYDTVTDAQTASYHNRIPFATYLTDSVAGLSVGSKVVMFGIQIGEVTDIALQLDTKHGTARVRVAMEIQPERAFPNEGEGNETPLQIAQHLVENGLRAQLASESFITGASDIALQFVPKAPPAEATVEGDTVILPSQKGGLSGIEDSLSDVASKLDALPLTEIADHLDGVLAGAANTLNGPDLKQTMHELAGTLRSIHALADHANHGLTPVLQKLPAIADQLDNTLQHANSILASYGGGSDFQANLQGVLGQVRDAARSLRLLADYLDRHPSSLLFGRAAPGRHQ